MHSIHQFITTFSIGSALTAVWYDLFISFVVTRTCVVCRYNLFDALLDPPQIFNVSGNSSDFLHFDRKTLISTLISHESETEI